MGPIPTNQESVNAGELGLSRGACFVSGRLDLVTVTLLLGFGGAAGCCGYRF